MYERKKVILSIGGRLFFATGEFGCTRIFIQVSGQFGVAEVQE